MFCGELVPLRNVRFLMPHQHSHYNNAKCFIIWCSQVENFPIKKYIFFGAVYTNSPFITFKMQLQPLFIFWRHITSNSSCRSSAAGRPELKFKDCHPWMKIRMISTILCDSYFHWNGTCTFYAEQLNRGWECTLCDSDKSIHSTRRTWSSSKHHKLLVWESLSFLHRNTIKRQDNR